MQELPQPTTPPVKTEFDLRVEAFDRELFELQEKHRIIVIPYQRVTDYGTTLHLQFADKNKIDEQIQAARAQAQQPLKA